MKRKEFIARFSACLVYVLRSKKEAADLIASNLYDRVPNLSTPEEEARKHIEEVLKIINKKN